MSNNSLPISYYQLPIAHVKLPPAPIRIIITTVNNISQSDAAEHIPIVSFWITVLADAVEVIVENSACSPFNTCRKCLSETKFDAATKGYAHEFFSSIKLRERVGNDVFRRFRLAIYSGYSDTSEQKWRETGFKNTITA